MASMNKVILMGNLTRDPEVRYTQGGTAVVEFGIATNRKYKGGDGSMQEEVFFGDITAWGRMAENIGQYLTKGRPVLVEGYLKLDQWETDDGQKRSKVKIIAQNVQFLGSGGGEGGNGRRSGGTTQRGGGGGGGTTTRGGDDGDMDLDDIPF